MTEEDDQSLHRWGIADPKAIKYLVILAEHESSGITEFIYRIIQVFRRTIHLTRALFLLVILDGFLYMYGLFGIINCPSQPLLPVYMVLASVVDCTAAVWLLCYNYANRQGIYQTLPRATKVIAYALALFVFGWLIFGSYLLQNWIWHIQSKCNAIVVVSSVVYVAYVWCVLIIFALSVLFVLVSKSWRCAWFSPHSHTLSMVSFGRAPPDALPVIVITSSV